MMPALLLALSLTACQPREHKEVIVRGVIEGAQVGQARVAMQATDLDEHGRFALHLEPDATGYMLLDVGEQIPLYLGPGDQVELHAKADSLFETLQLRGANAHINRYLIDAMGFADEIDFRALHAMPEDEFIARTLGLQAQFEERLQAFLDSHTGVTHAFAELERTSIRYAWARIRQQHPGFDGHVSVPGDSAFVDAFGFDLHPALRKGLEALTGAPPQ